MKTVSCKDMGVDCPWVGRAETIDELVGKAKDHAKSHHQAYWNDTMSKMPEADIKAQIEKAAKDE